MTLEVVHVAATGICTTYGGRAVAFRVVGSGAASDPEVARAVALSEASERALAHSWDARRARWASQDWLRRAGFRHVTPRELSRQRTVLEGRRFAATDVPQPWLRADSLTDGGPIRVPAAAVWLGTNVDPSITTPVTGTSNGMAAAPDVDTATIRAVLELCERDAVLAWWWGGARASRLDLSTASRRDLCALVGARTEMQAVVVERVAGIPVVAMVARSGSSFALGCGAGTDLEAALTHAIREAAAGLVHRSAPPVAAVPTPESVVSLATRYSFYFPTGRIWDEFGSRLPARTTGSDRHRDPGPHSPAVTPETLGRLLRDAGHRAYRVVMSSSRERYAVRVISDTLIPLNANPGEQAIRAVGIPDLLELADDRVHPHPVY